MNKLIYSVPFLLFQCGSYCQEIKDNKIDSSFIHSFSLGWSNPLSYISTNMENSSYNDSIFGILIDYQFLDEKKTINRFHLKFSPFYLNSNLTMSNFLISYTKGRTIHHKNKIIVPNSKKPTGTRTADREMTDGSGRTRTLDSNPKP